MMTVRRVFFSFHYQRDVKRIQQVRNSWVVREKGAAPPFYDAADFEEAKRRAGGIQAWIDDQITGCSVTAILYGYETYDREWVRYEIAQSVKRKMGIIAIDIHSIKDPVSGTDYQGRNPLEFFGLERTYPSMIGCVIAATTTSVRGSRTQHERPAADTGNR
ncbi:TIR domain-containing protein [Devosia sp. FJ2-5-3]|uniref:TIR domain-containing protein n=1 Tax=Devosia sp. FJ2-5-3 TaxID=2976680 RepID=UPI0023D8113E|nr:TIR domain-containing protein [Devosia sp. FJ2-5-3]WEJ56765.1 TIR domain-containing protein [Devosia sp. FJ2-5-3]